MILLPEDPQALGGSGDGRILEGPVRHDRNEQNGPAGPLEDSTELPERLPVVRHVLEHVTAVDDVECLVGVLDPSDVHPLHHVGVEHVGSQIPVAQPSPEPPLETLLRRDVQHPLGPSVEEVGALGEIQPGEAVPLQRAAAGALGVWPRKGAAGPERSRRLVTDRTPSPLSPVPDAECDIPEGSQEVEQLTGQVEPEALEQVAGG